MFKFSLYLTAALLFFLSCTQEKKPDDSFNRIKALEYSRETDPAKWIVLYEHLETESQKQLLINAAGKTKSRFLIPFLGRLANTVSSDSLLSEAVFALGQTGRPEAENILLALPFDSLQARLQPRLIFALSRCGSKQSVVFFKNLLKKGQYKKQVLTALTFFRRKDTGRYFFPADSSEAMAYYLNYAAGCKHIPFTASLIKNSPPLSQKYLLKTLSRLARRDSTCFLKVLRSDSLAFADLISALSAAQKKKADWKLQRYAAELIPLVKDSVLNSRLTRLLKSENPHLFLAAAEALTETVSAHDAAAQLLTLLSTEKNLFLRGELLKLLAKTDSPSAFRIIMQDLDRGDDRYKAAMLTALAAAKMKPAVKTIKQVIVVPNPRLANRAFELLTERGLDRPNDTRQLLSSEAYSSVSLALERIIEKKRSLPLEQAVNLYKKFNAPEAFVVQKSVLNYFPAKTILEDSLLQNLLWNGASHPFMQRLLKEKYPVVFGSGFEQKGYSTFLPAFLQPDSIINSRTNPVVLIQTSRGIVTVELFAQKAPLTVQNFLHLIYSGFYNNLSFHRVIADFVIQGGDPLGDGWGGTSWLIPSEDNDVPFERGSIGIATSGFDTGSCQFFICHSEQPHLTGNYTNFGRVTDGMPVVDRILPGDKILEIQIISGK